jgi:WD40 repeat protein
MAFTPDGKKLVGSYFLDRKTRLLEFDTGRELWAMPWVTFWRGRLVFTPDGKTLVQASMNNPLLRRFDAATGAERQDSPAPRAALQSVTLSADARTAGSVSPGGELRLWDAATGKQLRQVPADEGAVCSPDSRLAVTWRGRAHQVRDTETGKSLWAWESDPAFGAALRFSPDGRLLALREGGSAVALREAATGKVVRTCQGLKGPAQGIVFSAGGDLVLAWRERLEVEGQQPSGPHQGPPLEAAVWDATTGRLCRSLRDLPWSMIQRFALSRDGRWLALTAGDGKGIELREVATGQVRLRIPLAGDVQALTLAPDDAMLITSCAEERPAEPGVSFRCFDVRNGQPLCTQRGHGGTVRALALSGDGRRLVTGSDDTTALVWDLPALLPARPVLTATPRVELESRWADLAGEDVPRAYRAILVLAAAPRHAVPFLRERLRPAPPPIDPARLVQLMKDLDASRFSVRAKAGAELERLGEAAEPALARALFGEPSLEKRRRVEQLLGKIGKLREKAPPPERLRQVRALEALERCGTPEARRLLEALAGGADDAWLTGEARTALRHLPAARAKAGP